MKVVVASPLMICAQGLVSKRRKIEFRCATALGSMRAICVTRFRELVRLRFRKRSQDLFERDYVRVIRGIPPVCAAWVRLTRPPSVSCRNALRVHDEWEFLTKSDDASSDHHWTNHCTGHAACRVYAIQLWPVRHGRNVVSGLR